MFYAAVALLATRDLSSSRHSGVIALFHEHFVKSGAFPRVLAHTLGQALDIRTDTDYKVSVLPESAKLAKVLENARAFVQKAEDWSAPRSPHPIRTAKPRMDQPALASKRLRSSP